MRAHYADASIWWMVSLINEDLKQLDSDSKLQRTTQLLRKKKNQIIGSLPALNSLFCFSPLRIYPFYIIGISLFTDTFPTRKACETKLENLVSILPFQYWNMKCHFLRLPMGLRWAVQVTACRNLNIDIEENNYTHRHLAHLGPKTLGCLSGQYYAFWCLRAPPGNLFF